jgi:hypothetical protein
VIDRAHILLVSLFGFLYVVLDPLSTWYMFTKGGYELNPVVQYLLPRYGWPGLVGFKLILFGLALLIMRYMQPTVARYFLVGIVVLMVLVVLNNFLGHLFA